MKLERVDGDIKLLLAICGCFLLLYVVFGFRNHGKVIQINNTGIYSKILGIDRTGRWFLGFKQSHVLQIGDEVSCGKIIDECYKEK